MIIGCRISKLLSTLLVDVWKINPRNNMAYKLANQEVHSNDVNFLDIELVDGKPVISYLARNRIDLNQTQANMPYFQKGRQFGRIAVVLKKILNEKPDEIELKEFVESLTAEFIKVNFEIKVVSSKDMRGYYHKDNYAHGPDSELWKSCMRYDHCQDWLKFYEANDNLDLVVALKDGAVAARGLIWKNLRIPEHVAKGYRCELEKSEEITMLDRVYAVSPVAKNIVTRWAMGNVDLIHLNPKDRFTFLNPATHKIGSAYLEQDISEWKFMEYPWVDTMQVLDIENQILSNFDKNFFGYKRAGWKLNATEGKINRIDNNSPTLSQIRASLKAAEIRKRNKLERLADASASSSNFTVQSASITSTTQGHYFNPTITGTWISPTPTQRPSIGVLAAQFADALVDPLNVPQETVPAPDWLDNEQTAAEEAAAEEAAAEEAAWADFDVVVEEDGEPHF